MMLLRAAAATVLVLSCSPAIAQTGDRFNLTCKPVSHTFTGNNTFGEALTPEAYQGIVEEVVERAVDLAKKEACNPNYCTEDSFGGPSPLALVTAAEIVFDDIAPREVESADYNVMGAREALDRKTSTLSITYVFLDEEQMKQTGTFTLVKSCTVSPWKLAGK